MRHAGRMTTTVDDDTRRALLERQMQQLVADGDPLAAHAIYHDDAVLEFPQSGERFEGVDNFREWRAQYPADVEFHIRRISGSGDVWVRELSVSYDRGPWSWESAWSSSGAIASVASASTSPSPSPLRSGGRLGVPPRSPSEHGVSG
jgi:SnoaL-like domain